MTPQRDDIPWSVPVRLEVVGAGLTRRLVAEEAVRARIAKALDLAGLDSLEADVEVRPVLDTHYEIRGRFRAAVVYTCGVTLETFPSEVDGDFDMRATTDPAAVSYEDSGEITLETMDPPDLIEHGVLDLGAYVVEQLALGLDAFPRKPGVEFETPAQEAEPSPFAKLAQLKLNNPER
ncbi:DUF177 domain-containing protein [Caulobacter sp. 17J65-9]|uniref:YceD family protein n=1 Tax=Caulobacter sp. 17J65-9 TaxID=2709382 RepID=UPI0013CB93F7|nr:DUF177 domain-containing protein [Caulobacter sp. 17J65-9]NEX92085.1 DUF177 domain-containing protein [Caulobacter sp. 17J65-9]